jgi:hypothetical protein
MADLLSALGSTHHLVDGDFDDNTIFANFWLAIPARIRFNGLGDNIGFGAQLYGSLESDPTTAINLAHDGSAALGRMACLHRFRKCNDAHNVVISVKGEPNGDNMRRTIGAQSCQSC